VSASFPPWCGGIIISGGVVSGVFVGGWSGGGGLDKVRVI